ncbi:MAG: gliding motility-associated C-terminal domain-containing protein [Bacteroidota bacterium]
MSTSLPALVFESLTDTLEECLYEQPNQKTLLIRNVGAGVALNVELELKKFYYAGQFQEYQYDGLDPNSAQISFDGINFAPLVAKNVEGNLYGNACSLPLAYRFLVDIPLISAGDSVWVSFEMINCVPTACGEEEIRQGAWGYNCRYDLPCTGNAIFIANQIGGQFGVLTHELSNFDPPSLVSGKQAVFTTTIEKAEENFPGTGQYVVQYLLPQCGASFSGSSGDLAWTNIGGNISWPQAAFSQVGDTVEARYNLADMPNNFVLNGSEIRLSLSGDCSCGPLDSVAVLKKEIFFVPNLSCSPPAEVRVFCDSAQVIVDPCNNNSCDGIRLMDFAFARVNYGLPDNNLDRRPDNPAGSLGSNVRRDRARLGDTIRTTLTGFVDGTNSYSHGYAEMTISLAQYLSAIGAELRYWDASTGSYLSCSAITPSLNGNIFQVDFSPTSLAGICPSFAGLSLDPGDSILLEVDYIVTGTSAQNVDVGTIFPVNIYGSNVPNPAVADQFACQGSNFSELMQLVPMADASFVTPVSGHSCQQLQARTYLNMFTGGSYTDMFPAEYRPWSFPDSLLVTPPPGFDFVNASIYLRFTPYDFITAVIPVDPTATPLVFDLKSLVDNGTLTYPDDGYELQFFTNWLPTCAAPANQAVSVPVEGRFSWANGLAAYDTLRTYQPTIQHYAPQLSLNNLSATTQDGLSSEVNWTIEVSNTALNSSSPFTWLSFQSPSGDISLTQVTDLSSGNAVAVSQDIFELGSLGTTSTRSFELTANYSRCQMDTLWVYVGYECGGYPDSLGGVGCAVDSFLLRIDPKPANAQITLNNNPPDTVALGAIIPYDLSILSTQIANVQNLVLDITHAQDGLDFVSGSAQLEFPNNGGFVTIADPVAIPGGYRFVMANYDATLASDGLAGLQSGTADDRRLNLRFDLSPNCNYASGDIFTARLGANLPCGDTLVILRLMDPLFIQGVNPSYQGMVDLRLVALETCDLSEWELSFRPDGDAVAGGDSLHLWLDPGYGYEVGSFQAMYGSLPNTTPVMQNDRLAWGLPPGLADGDSVVFRIKLRETSPSACPTGKQLSHVLQSTFEYTTNCQGGGGISQNGQTGVDSLNLTVPSNLAPQMALSFPSPQPVLISQDTVDWVLDLSHQLGNYASDYNWLHLYSPNNSVKALELTDQASGTPLSAQQGIWQIGVVQVGQTRRLVLKTEVSLCQADTFYLLSGWSCAGYPGGIGAANCEIDTLMMTYQTTGGSLALNIVRADDPACFGMANGEIELAGAGGFGPYEYALGNQAFISASVFSGLTAGNYTLQVRDQGGCTASTTVNLQQPAVLQLSSTGSTDPDCAGNPTGQIDLAAQGGTPQYAFGILGGSLQASSSLSGLSEGTYQVVVQDVAGCRDSLAVTLSAPPALQTNLQLTQSLDCFGDQDGILTAQMSGGSGPLSGQWQGGSPDSLMFSGLGAGSYYFTVTDSLGCSVSDTISLTQPADIQSQLSIDTPISCFGGNDGAISVQAQGGTGTLSYQWSGGWPAQASLSQLPTGTYRVTIVDQQGCSKLDSIALPQPAFMQLNMQAADVSCFGRANGVITTQVSGGMGPYQYSWTHQPSLNNPAVSGLAAGTYGLTVTDAEGCQRTQSVQIQEPAPLLIQLDSMDENCSARNGFLVAQVSGGNGGYLYAWDTNPVQFTDSAVQLGAGTYQVVVTDQMGCSDSASANLVNHLSPAIAVDQITPPACYGGNDGSASVIVTSGQGPFQYTWSNGITGPSASGLSAGTYLVTVDDGVCQGTAQVLVPQPAALDIRLLIQQPPRCAGESNGRISVSPSGGTGTYQYLWSHGDSLATINQLTAGSYTVRVQDDNQCLDSMTISLSDPAPLSATASLQDASCFGMADGQATAHVSGGNGYYRYFWEDGQRDSLARNLPPGPVSLRFQDRLGCFDSLTVVIGEPAELQLTLNQQNPICFGENSGQATVLVEGGTPAYGYLWSNGQTTTTATDLAAGSHYVGVWDANGCLDTIQVHLQEAAPISVQLLSVDTAYCGMDNGQLAVAASGGGGSFSFSWENPAQQGAILSQVGAGIYAVRVQDQLGCSVSESFSLPGSGQPVADFRVQLAGNGNPFFQHQPLQMINQSVGAIAYQWEFGINGAISDAPHPVFAYPEAGRYQILLTAFDPHFMCPDTATVWVDITGTVPTGTIYAPSAFSPNADGFNDAFQLYGDKVATHQLQIFNRWGQLVFEADDIQASWNGIDQRGRTCPEGVYVFVVKGTFTDGQAFEEKGSISLMR